MLHVLQRSWNDDAVVVTAIARPDAHQLVGLGIDEGDPARQTLKAAEHAHHVLAVVGDRERQEVVLDVRVTASVCMSGPMPWISFLIFQVLVSTTMMPLAAGEGCRIER